MFRHFLTLQSLSNFSQKEEEKSDEALEAIGKNDVEGLQRILSSTVRKSRDWDLREKVKYNCHKCFRTVVYLFMHAAPFIVKTIRSHL